MAFNLSLVETSCDLLPTAGSQDLQGPMALLCIRQGVRQCWLRLASSLFPCWLGMFNTTAENIVPQNMVVTKIRVSKWYDLNQSKQRKA